MRARQTLLRQARTPTLGGAGCVSLDPLPRPGSSSRPLRGSRASTDRTFLFYHDTVWQGVDCDETNRAVFRALRPGGVYGIVDHSARAGRGLADVETLHRIEESVLRAEVGRAGFRLAGEADFLRHSDDERDWSASPRVAGARRGTSDRFVPRFEKPAGAPTR